MVEIFDIVFWNVCLNVQETIELDAEEPVETESAPDAVKDAPPAVSGSNVPDTAQVSANTATVIVKKTNTQMLAEMMDYWQKDNVEAVEDLSGLAHYRAMSASLKSSAYFYYYGDRNEQGRPEGTGIAVYGEDQYYYGEWKDGLRSGKAVRSSRTRFFTAHPSPFPVYEVSFT